MKGNQDARFPKERRRLRGSLSSGAVLLSALMIPALGYAGDANRTTYPPFAPPPLTDACRHAMNAASSNSAQVSTWGTQRFTTELNGRGKLVGSAESPPLPGEVAGASAGTVVSARNSPEVTYRNSQLTIDAEGSTLAAVLRLVAEKTGAMIDIPPESGLERIVVHMGPARAEDVLAELLKGAPFDFVIVSSPQPPHDLAEVLLFLPSADTPASPAPQPSTANKAPAQPQTFKTPSSFPPPEAAPATVILPVQFDNENVEPPKEPLPPDTLERMMKDRSQQLREYLQQQQQQ
jgi:hypothetical protein